MTYEACNCYEIQDDRASLRSRRVISKTLSAILCVCVLLLSPPANLRSQEITGTISGTVRDTTGNVIVGAQIEAKNEDTGLAVKTVSAASGDFAFPLLPSGRYTVTVSSAGFRSFVKEHVVVEVNQTVRVETDLQLGDVNQTVTVRAEGAALKTTSGGEGTTLEQRTVESVPNLERNPLNLAFLSPNAAPSNYTRESYTGSGTLSSFSGARFDANEIQMDGASILNPEANYTGPNPPLEAVAEVLINTSAYSAEYGRALGANVGLTTKWGTNDYHGAAWDYNRVSALMSRGFFDRTKPRLTRNMYGFDLGGPVKIPKVYDGRNRTFFFLTFEGFRQIEGATSLGTVPTTAMVGGNFSGQPTIYDPQTTVNGVRQPFAGNIIPASRFDPVALKILAYYPTPNAVGAANYILALPAGDYYDRWVGRLDQDFGEKHRIFGRVLYDYSRSTASNAAPRTLPSELADPQARHQLNATPDNMVVGYTYTISPTIVNELRLTYMRYNSTNTQDSLGQNVPTQLGLQGVNPLVFPAISVQGYLGMGVGNQGNYNIDNIYGLSETVSLERNRHLLKVGGSYLLENLNKLSQGTVSGSFAFNTFPTAQVGQSGSTGSPIASLLLGIPTSSTVQALGPEFAYFSTNAALFVADTWRVGPDLTLNLGLRWEVETPFVERYNQLSTFDLSTRQLVFAGQNGVPRGLANLDLNNFGPRVGVAWSPRNSRWAVRGGYALFYANMFAGQYGAASSQGFSNSVTYQSTDNGVTFPIQLANGIPPVPSVYKNPTVPARSNVAVFERRAPTSSMSQWDFSVERQVGGFVLDLTYTGSKGSNLLGPANNINQVPIALWGPGNAQLLRPYPNLGNVSVALYPALSSFYDGMSFSVNRRYASGLTLASSFTWQKSLDYGSGGGIVDSATYPQDQNNYAIEKSLSQFDRTLRLIVGPVYEVPLFAGTRGFRKTAFGGWQVAANLEVMSGTPIALGLASNLENSLGGSGRPNRVPGVDPGLSNQGPAEWFNTAAFAAPPAYTIGNESRTDPSLRNPGWHYLDSALSKTFPIRERAGLEFRAEAFNITNTANFGNVVRTFGVPTFGEILSANPARRIQFALKLKF